MEKKNITSEITNEVFRILKSRPEGIRWTDLAREVNKSDKFHPKTVNGIIWKFPENHADQVYKPEKGVFKLLKYKD